MSQKRGTRLWWFLAASGVVSLTSLSMFFSDVPAFSSHHNLDGFDLPVPLQNALTPQLNTTVPTSMIDFQGIAKKWDLFLPSSIPLLEQQAQRVIDYDKTTDLLAFFHPQKTGGTSLSDVLEKIFTSEKVVPGSGRSSPFHMPRFHEALDQHPLADGDKDDFWKNMRGLYSHSMLRYGPNGTNNNRPLLQFLRSTIPALAELKTRLIVMIRDPVNWRASQFYEGYCHVGRWLKEQKKKQRKNNRKDTLPSVVVECPPINLTDVARSRLETARSNRQGKATALCRRIHNGEHPFDYCASIDTLLDLRMMHNQYESKFMGRLPQPPGKNDSLTPTYEQVEHYTLRDLGGLEDFHETYREDFVWFGITERMQESMCLFYYTLKLEPQPMPHERFKTCRPAALWEKRHIARLHETEKFDYTIWRAANAILDVRMEWMRIDIDNRLAAGEAMESIAYLAEGCYKKQV